MELQYRHVTSPGGVAIVMAENNHLSYLGRSVQLLVLLFWNGSSIHMKSAKGLKVSFSRELSRCIGGCKEVVEDPDRDTVIKLITL